MQCVNNIHHPGLSYLFEKSDPNLSPLTPSLRKHNNPQTNTNISTVLYFTLKFCFSYKRTAFRGPGAIQISLAWDTRMSLILH